MSYVISWSPPFQQITGGGKGPYSGRILPPSITAVSVDNPPFEHPGRTDQSQALIATIAQPDPWQYDFSGGQSPYVGKKVPPSVADVPVNNPPFSQRAQLPIDAGWTPSGPFRQAQARVPPAAPVAFLNSIGGMIQAVMLAWQVVAPQPVFATPLNPAVLNVRIDEPPVMVRPASFDAVLASWRAPNPHPILPRYVPQAPISAFIPSPPVWLPGVIAAWNPVDTPAAAPPRLNPSIAAVPVNTPPFNLSTASANAILAAWNPADPQIFVLKGPIQGQVTADPPPANTNAAVVVSTWTVPDSQPIVPRGPNPAILAVRVDNPLFARLALDTILTAWRAVDPLLVIATDAIAATQAPAINPFTNFNAAAIISAWAAPDFQPLGLPRLNPSLLAVRVDNPPLASLRIAVNHAILNSWHLPAAQPQTASYLPQPGAKAFIPSPDGWMAGVFSAWVPGPPQPIIAANLNPSFLAVPINNPPFGANSQTAVLVAWQPLDSLPVLPRARPLGEPLPSFFVSPNSSLPAILSSWALDAPQLILGRGINPAVLNVPANNPPFWLREQTTILLAWQPTDVLRQAPRSIPQGAIVLLVPPLPSSLPAIMAAWQQVDSVLQPLRFIPQVPAAVFVPAQAAWLPAVLSAWSPRDPAPVTRNSFIPSLAVSVSNPPFARLPSVLQSVLLAWGLPDSAPIIGRPTSPSLLNVRVDNPPVGLQSGTAIAISWVPAIGQVPGLLSPAILSRLLLAVDPEYLLQYPDTVTMIQYPDTVTMIQYP